MKHIIVVAGLFQIKEFQQLTTKLQLEGLNYNKYKCINLRHAKLAVATSSN